MEELQRILVGWSDELSLPDSTPSVIFHFASYALWAFLLSGAIRKTYWSKLTVLHAIFFLPIILLFVSLQEGLQAFNPNRYPSLSDVGINFAGSLTGLFTTHVGGFAVPVRG